MSTAPPGEANPEPTRRNALVGIAAGVAGVAVLGTTWWRTQGAVDGAAVGTASGTSVVPASPLPSPASPAVLPAGADLGVSGVAAFRTPTEDFFQIDTAFGQPRLTADAWRLRIHGMVTRELELRYDDLLALELIERDVTLSCVSNEVGGDLIGNATWLGTRIAPLLAKAGVQPGADMVLSRSVDDWTASTPLEALTDRRDSLLAIGMNGAVLQPKHGYPVRMVVPGLYGFVSATKWVVELQVTRFDRASAYWTSRGWSDHGPIKTASRIDTPHPGDRLRAGAIAIGGVAWAASGISAVEVRVDDGPWQRARTGASAGSGVWRQWSLTWQAMPGDHTLTVRAIDGTGAVQTETKTPPAPDGASGWQSIEVNVA